MTPPSLPRVHGLCRGPLASGREAPPSLRSPSPALIWAGLLLGCAGGSDGESSGPPLPDRAAEQLCFPLRDGVAVPTLTDTGCFVDVPSLAPTPDLVPYAPHSQLWTDGAEKGRWIVVPPDAVVTLVGDEFQLPPGTILVKLFQLDGVEGDPDPRRMEVRFLVREASQWEMFTYRFDEAGNEANLLEELETEALVVDNQDVEYLFPDETSCRACHDRSLPVLGFTPIQLNFDYDYGPARANQIIALSDIGLIVSEAFADPEALPRLADPQRRRSGDLETRARSWLHANCAHCHRPQGFAWSIGMDLRFSTPFEETATCDTAIQFFGTASSSPWRLDPGNPDGSGILVRINEEDPMFRMPPIGVSIVDPTGSDVLRQWIDSLSVCP